MNKTPWFPVKTKPVRGGLYEFRWPGTRGRMALWNGGNWHGRFKDGSFSYFAFHLLGDETWRGLYAKPENVPRLTVKNKPAK